MQDAAFNWDMCDKPVSMNTPECKTGIVVYEKTARLLKRYKKYYIPFSLSLLLGYVTLIHGCIFLWHSTDIVFMFLRRR